MKEMDLRMFLESRISNVATIAEVFAGVLYSTFKDCVNHIVKNKATYIERIKELQYYIMEIVKFLIEVGELTFNNVKMLIKGLNNAKSK